MSVLVTDGNERAALAVTRALNESRSADQLSEAARALERIEQTVYPTSAFATT